MWLSAYILRLSIKSKWKKSEKKLRKKKLNFIQRYEKTKICINRTPAWITEEMMTAKFIALKSKEKKGSFYSCSKIKESLFRFLFSFIFTIHIYIHICISLYVCMYGCLLASWCSATVTTGKVNKTFLSKTLVRQRRVKRRGDARHNLPVCKHFLIWNFLCYWQSCKQQYKMFS